MNEHRIVREGIIAGLIGAAGVAIWFLIVDTVQGQPFRTPAMLGSALLSIFGARGAEGTITFVLVYTVFHGLAFLGVGILLTFLVHHAENDPEVLAAIIVLFIIFELGFAGLVALLAESPLFGTLAWYQVAAGNAIASVGMGYFLWRRHPKLRAGLSHAYD